MVNKETPTGQGQGEAQAVEIQYKDSEFQPEKQAPQNERSAIVNPALEELKKKIEAARPVNNAATISPPADPQPDERTAYYLELLRQSVIDPATPIEKPPICLRLQGDKEQTVIATLGNFSMIIGKAKSRKTFLITIALAAATRNNPVLNFIGDLPAGQNFVLYFDTEQGKYHAYKTVKRICELADIGLPQNFTAYSLRKFSPADRLAIIEAAIYNTPGLGFVVIDGVRDLVSSINDEEQATMLSSFLLRCTEELNIHITAVLHQNKTDTNARGHLGSELQNKAETVLSVTKDTKNKEISIVEAEFCRDKEPDPFAFEIFDGLPVLVPDWEIKTSKAGNPKQLTPDEIPIETHLKVLREIFKKYPQPLRSVIEDNLIIQFKSLANLKIGKNKAGQFITYYKSEGILSVNESNKTTEKFHILNDIQKVTKDETPF